MEDREEAHSLYSITYGCLFYGVVIKTDKSCLSLLLHPIVIFHAETSN